MGNVHDIDLLRFLVDGIYPLVNPVRGTAIEDKLIAANEGEHTFGENVVD